jgi:hypothetical protein
MSAELQQPDRQPSNGCLHFPCSALYGRVITPSQDDLLHKVWDPFPWMVDAYTGSSSEARWREIMEWCHTEFGRQAWPIHGIDGQWHSGTFTLHGWTWVGFAT